jgi:hypothetical protein
MERPRFGERINGGQNSAKSTAGFPLLPKVAPRRITGDRNLWVLEANLDYGDVDPWQCAFVLEMRNGLIAKEVTDSTKPFPALLCAPHWSSVCRCHTYRLYCLYVRLKVLDVVKLPFVPGK